MLTAIDSSPRCAALSKLKPARKSLVVQDINYSLLGAAGES